MRKHGVVTQITKTALLMALAVLLSLGCAGCRWLRDDNKAALKYMEEKYGEKFEYAGSAGTALDPNWHELYVSCESIPDKNVLVTIRMGAVNTYTDNYMNYYYIPQVTEYLHRIADNFFSDVSVDIIYIGGLGEAGAEGITPATTTFEELINGSYYVSGYIITDILDESILNSFLEELKNQKIDFSFRISSSLTDDEYIARYDNGDIYVRYIGGTG